MSIIIPIISEFQGKGFKEAQKQTSALDKGLKRLAVTLGAALSVRKITQYSKASIKAFVEEDKAVQALARNLENLGLAYDVRPIEAYIRELQYATGVADSELRPALQQLVTATKSLGSAQELLALSLDIAAGTGRSLGSVTQALSRAYLGTTTSLSRLNIGLSKADLTSKSFSQITEELTQRFSGQAARAAGTYAGQLAILTAAANDAQEILGQKLVKSLELLLDEEKGVPALAGAFEKMATDIGDISLGLASIGKQIKSIGGLVPGGGFDILAIPVIGPYLDFLRNRGRSEASKAQGKADAIARANSKEQGIIRSKTLRTEIGITKQKVEQNKQTKEANKLQKAGQAFNDDLISLEAALKNEQLSENEILRLKLKKQLVLENADQAEKLAKKLADSQAELARLSQFKPADPFQAWLDSLDKVRDRLGNLGVQVAPVAPGGAITQQPLVPSVVPPGQSGLIPPTITQQDLNDIFGGAAMGGGVMAPTININVTGTGDLSDDTKKKIVDTIIDYSSIGYSTSGWYRTTGNIAL